MSRKPPVLEVVPEKCLHRNDAGSLKLTISFYVGGLFIFICIMISFSSLSLMLPLFRQSSIW